MAWALDTDQVAASGPVTIPGLGGIWDADTKYQAEALGLTDAELSEAVAKLGLPIKQVSGSGLAEVAATPGKSPSAALGSSEEAPPPQPDGELTRQAVARADELSAARETPDATESAVELAAEKNIDLAAVEGSGAGGRVTKADIEAAADAAAGEGG
jgi:pyruvate/2-oxoglutarate dehydrogenase complex dihydrolipoamide acyltransferase (E2) component